MSRVDAGFNQPVRHAVGGVVQLGVRQVPLTEDQRRLVQHARGGGFKNVGQDLVAQQVRADLGRAGWGKSVAGFRLRHITFS